MRYTTRTEYGLICMIYLTQHREATRVTIKEIAKKENYPLPYLEKILQSLRQAKLVEARHGNQGGYVLSKKASEITVKEVIEALEGSTFQAFCAPSVREEIVCNHICMCGVKPMWHRTKEVLDRFFESITLDMLAQPQAQAQSLMPVAR